MQAKQVEIPKRIAFRGLSLIFIGCEVFLFPGENYTLQFTSLLSERRRADPVSDSYSLPSSGICGNEMANLANPEEEIPKTLASVCLIDCITLNEEKLNKESVA